MYQNYFEYNCEKYYSGTQIRILNYPYNNPVQSDLAYFVYYDKEHDIVWYKMAWTNKQQGCSMKSFLNKFGGATGEIDSSIRPPEMKQLKDYQIPKLMIGWMWYIFIMLVGTIFKAAVAIWVAASIIFFSWRKDVIEQEGYYVEW